MPEVLGLLVGEGLKSMLFGKIDQGDGVLTVEHVEVTFCIQFSEGIDTFFQGLWMHHLSSINEDFPQSATSLIVARISSLCSFEMTLSVIA